MKFEDFEKQYEDVYTSDKGLARCDFDKVSTDIGLSLAEYAVTFRQFLQQQQATVFENLVKIVWLSRRFMYNGRRRKKLGQNGWNLDSAFGIFIKRVVGYDASFFYSSHGTAVASYLDEFFSDFDINNPFDNKYDYPYKHMTLECLSLVYKMKERNELLKRGESRKMTVPEFYDYVINYISCYNEKYGDTYKFSFQHWAPRYIQILNKKDERK